MAQAARQMASTPSQPRVLVVEDDAALREALCDTLQLANYEVWEADSGEQALARLSEDSDCHMIVSDVNMPGISGQQLLQTVRQQYPQIPMMLITAYASVSQSVDAIKQGAVDYLVKPFEPKLLVETLARHLDGSGQAGDEPVASAPSSQRLLQLAQRVAQSESTVLILGESGTGKEVLARYIHTHSPRHRRPFVAINCAAIPENMLEAVLFGHEKGAYTGAHSSAPGKFEQANGGTLLLDEISEMDVALQAKLLRVLQEREVERLGGRKTIALDVRVIATSNRDMREQVAQGQFREDLYYRLSVLPLQWLPLRERTEDIVPMAEQLLAKHAQKQRRGWVKLAESARAALARHRWPGNVRELDNVMQRALILQPGELIQAEDLALDADFAYAEAPKEPEVFAPAPVSQAGAPAANSAPPEPPTSPVLGNDLKRREFEIIVNTLNSERGSKKRTAERLGISPRTLRYKMARLRDAGFPVDGLA
ncbi:sigma-54-dependent transcriptional regulator [Marinimicrobium locisalis]|uniref:sigma-54-dependent transcriptional regulator n=1 Tax=Marinimicrobium locisalis TaxID=546022 RepID=UPI0032214B8C